MVSHLVVIYEVGGSILFDEKIKIRVLDLFSLIGDVLWHAFIGSRVTLRFGHFDAQSTQSLAMSTPVMSDPVPYNHLPCQH